MPKFKQLFESANHPVVIRGGASNWSPPLGTPLTSLTQWQLVQHPELAKSTSPESLLLRFCPSAWCTSHLNVQQKREIDSILCEREQLLPADPTDEKSTFSLPFSVDLHLQAGVHSCSIHSYLIYASTVTEESPLSVAFDILYPLSLSHTHIHSAFSDISSILDLWRRANR